MALATQIAFKFFPIKQVEADEIAQWVEILASKPDDLSFIRGTHVVGEEETDSHNLPSGLHTSQCKVGS